VQGAKANDLPDPIPEEVKQERYERFMELQAEISANKLQAKIGKTMQVLVDEVYEDYAIARSSADAPEIDGQVIIENPNQLKAGEFTRVKIIATETYDLIAELA
jgi:ribosomal protein S12 methylthiotransferase